MKMNSSVLILTSDLRLPAKLMGGNSLADCEVVQFVIEDFNQAMLEYVGLEGIIIVDDFANQAELKQIVERFLKARHFDCVIAMDEFSLMPAAYFREVLGIPGIDYYSARALRDKVLMKRILFSNGVLTPRLYEFLEMNTGIGFPIIIKPRALAGSVGVVKLESYTEFKNLGLRPESFNYDEFHDMADGELHIESFVEGDLFHIDGISIDKCPAFWCLGQYVNSQMNYLKGESFGSFSRDRGEFSFIRGHLENIFHALHFPDGAFHLEAFVDQQRQDIVVLEIAARPGGGGICKTIYSEYGIDLNVAHVESQLRGSFLGQFKNPAKNVAYGWVSVPFLAVSKLDRLLSINFEVAKDVEVVQLKTVPLGARLNHAFYSHERSLAEIIVKGERAAVSHEIAKLCVDKCYETFESHE